MREHYATPRGIGVPQVATDLKEQYFDQLNKIRDYSNSQLAKSHENYIFQRQRLRKFSAQNYLKIRETGKYTQKTLNRVLENMPAVGDLTNCRQWQVWQLLELTRRYCQIRDQIEIICKSSEIICPEINPKPAHDLRP